MSPSEPAAGARMTDPEARELERQNAYLKLRNAQLQEDIAAVTAESERLRQMLERVNGRRAARPPSPVSGGQ